MKKKHENFSFETTTHTHIYIYNTIDFFILFLPLGFDEWIGWLVHFIIIIIICTTHTHIDTFDFFLSSIFGIFFSRSSLFFTFYFTFERIDIFFLQPFGHRVYLITQATCTHTHTYTLSWVFDLIYYSTTTTTTTKKKKKLTEYQILRKFPLWCILVFSVFFFKNLGIHCVFLFFFVSK